MDCVNDYIVATIEKGDLRYFSYFLHHTEVRLNGRAANFLLREGLDRYDPERFLYYKQNCFFAMLECLKTYDPGKGAEFLAFSSETLITLRKRQSSTRPRRGSTAVRPRFMPPCRTRRNRRRCDTGRFLGLYHHPVERHAGKSRADGI